MLTDSQLLILKNAYIDAHDAELEQEEFEEGAGLGPCAVAEILRLRYELMKVRTDMLRTDFKSESDRREYVLSYVEKALASIESTKGK